MLSDEERSKGWVRPYREAYTHVGDAGPKHPTRELTAEEQERYGEFEYKLFESYPDADETGLIGRFWTQKDLDRIGAGCGTSTKMNSTIAATYAREPTYYGSTFCTGCKTHFPVGEFVWDGTEEVVGS